jgi:hypothetical protein
MQGGFYAYYPYSRTRKSLMQSRGRERGRGKGLRKMRKMKTFKRRI